MMCHPSTVKANISPTTFNIKPLSIPKALVNTKRDYERTFLCIVEDAPVSEAVTGYFSLRASTYSFGYTVVPVVEIFALARHVEHKGQDWGNVLLSEALAKIAEASERIGVTGVQLNPTDQGIRLYREFGFSEHPLAGNTNKMFLPIRMIPPL